MTGNERSTNVAWSDADDAPELTVEFVKQAARVAVPPTTRTWNPGSRSYSIVRSGREAACQRQ